MAELTDEERSELELSLCKEDESWMLERHFVIQNKMGQIQLLSPLRQAQRRAFKILQWQRERGMPARLIVGKSRKKGLSTGMAADAFYQYLVNDINVMVIAHEKELAETVLSYMHRFHKFLDQSMRKDIPPIRKPGYFKGDSSKSEIRLEGYESKIWVGTAKNVYAGTGMTPQYLFATEVSKWDTGSKTAISLLQSVALKPGTTVVWECTFNGEDTLFFPAWKAAYDNAVLRFGEDDAVDFEVTKPEKWNHYVPYFTGTADDPDVPLEFYSDAEKARFETTLTEQERTWIDKYGVSLEWCNGMRAVLASQCQGKEDIRAQEFCVTPEEAVIASGATRFNIHKLNAMQQRYVEDGERGELSYSDSWNRKILFRRDSGGMMIRFRQPKHGHRYVIGCDTAEGKLDERGNERDATVATCHDLDEGMEQVAIIYGNISPENIVVPLAMMGEYYNRAFIVPESNSSGSHTCIELGKIYPQERLYHSGDNVEESNRISREIGFRTTIATKPHLVGDLAAAIEEDAILIHCERTFDELRHYIKKAGGGTEAAPGYHDDHPMSVALALQGAKSRPVLLDRKQNPDAIERHYQMVKRPLGQEGRSSITGY